MGSHLFDYPIRRTHTFFFSSGCEGSLGKKKSVSLLGFLSFSLSNAIVSALSFFLFLARFGIAIILITLDLIPFPSLPLFYSRRYIGYYRKCSDG